MKSCLMLRLRVSMISTVEETKDFRETTEEFQ